MEYKIGDNIIYRDEWYNVDKYATIKEIDENDGDYRVRNYDDLDDIWICECDIIEKTDKKYEGLEYGKLVRVTKCIVDKYGYFVADKGEIGKVKYKSKDSYTIAIERADCTIYSTIPSEFLEIVATEEKINMMMSKVGTTLSKVGLESGELLLKLRNVIEDYCKELDGGDYEK